MGIKDAEEVYKKAIPDKTGASWYGRNAQGDIDRYSDSKTPGDGTPVHFSGSTNSEHGLKVPHYIEKRFRDLDKGLKIKNNQNN